MTTRIEDNTTPIEHFIVLEGLDGAGTTTQLDRLVKHIGKKNPAVARTFEPTDSAIGRLIRSIQRGEESVTSESLALLYSADRHNHIYGKGGIIELAGSGSFVLSDRYFYSSIAYQSSFCDPDFVRSINRYPDPEFLIFIDTPVEECMKRIDKRDGRKEIFEKEEILRTVRSNYLKAFASLPCNVKFLRLDGTLSIEETTKAILEFLNL